MTEADLDLQYHLITDASLINLSEVLFQILNTSANIELT